MERTSGTEKAKMRTAILQKAMGSMMQAYRRKACSDAMNQHRIFSAPDR
jgi:hypothetical protein